MDDNYFKVNLAIYDTDVLVVTGTSYFLWVMDNFKEISAEVLKIWEEENKVEFKVTIRIKHKNYNLGRGGGERARGGEQPGNFEH